MITAGYRILRKKKNGERKMGRGAVGINLNKP